MPALYSQFVEMTNESDLYLQYGKEEENEPPQLDWSKQPNNGI